MKYALAILASVCLIGSLYGFLFFTPKLYTGTDTYAINEINALILENESIANFFLLAMGLVYAAGFLYLINRKK